MMIAPGKDTTEEQDENTQPEQVWDNPADPESAGDQRDIEQLERQKKEAEMRKSNLTDTDETK